ncbi:MAG: glutathione S-transferase [Beijerinckiaceae bacterium]
MLLTMGNKNYSSWSLRPWIAMKQMGLAFDEAIIPMARPESKDAMRKVSPNALLPVLQDGDLLISETIAILEYLNDLHPMAGLWPEDIRARAHARAISAEMHAGFAVLRRDCPMNIRRPVRKHIPSPEGQAQAARVDAIWTDTRARFGVGGALLFGQFTAADAMFAPVVNRFHVYDLPRSATSHAYMAAMMALPAWQEWEAAASAETWVIDSSEVA